MIKWKAVHKAPRGSIYESDLGDFKIFPIGMSGRFHLRKLDKEKKDFNPRPFNITGTLKVCKEAAEKILEEDTGVVSAPKNTNLTATVYLPGDKNVGISDSSIKIDFGNYLDYSTLFNCYEGGRTEFRNGLKEWADEWMFNCAPSKVIFGDELNG
jgi:hypothetical protein